MIMMMVAVLKEMGGWLHCIINFPVTLVLWQIHILYVFLMRTVSFLPLEEISTLLLMVLVVYSYKHSAYKSTCYSHSVSASLMTYSTIKSKCCVDKASHPKLEIHQTKASIY
jgi:hypothetical protein